MRYYNLKFGYNKASVKCTAFQNCTGKKKHYSTKPHQNLMEHKMCLVNGMKTKPHLGKVCNFLPILLSRGCMIDTLL